MRSHILTPIPSLMLISNTIWAAYGINTSPVESFEMDTLPENVETSPTSHSSLLLDTAAAPTPSASPPTQIVEAIESEPSHASTVEPSSKAMTTALFETEIPVAPSAASESTPGPGISTAAVAGLCIGAGFFVLLVLGAVLGWIARRRQRAASRVRGEETESVESEEGGLQEKGGVVIDDGEVGEKEVEVEMGRKGMSLPRRMW